MAWSQGLGGGWEKELLQILVRPQKGDRFRGNDNRWFEDDKAWHC
jgi:hypothetical protein